MTPVSQREQAEAFRRLHQGPELLVLPNAWDVATARLVEAVRRANAYRAAGADCLFVVHVRDAATIGRLAREIAGPLNVIAGPPAPTLGELARLGVRRASLGPRLPQAALGFVRRMLTELRARGTYSAMAEAVIPFAELQRLVTPAP